MFFPCFKKYILKNNYTFFYFLFLFISLPAHSVNNIPTTESYDNKTCIECHEKDNPGLISDWRDSVHASTKPVTSCISCHGNLHSETGRFSRQNTTCIDCHGGKKSPAYIVTPHQNMEQLCKWNRTVMTGKSHSPVQTIEHPAVVTAICMKVTTM